MASFNAAPLLLALLVIGSSATLLSEFNCDSQPCSKLNWMLEQVKRDVNPSVERRERDEYRLMRRLRRAQAPLDSFYGEQDFRADQPLQLLPKRLAKRSFGLPNGQSGSDSEYLLRINP